MKIWFLILAVFLTASCTKMMDDYVEGAVRRPGISTNPNPALVPQHISISPGAVHSVGPTLGAELSISHVTTVKN